ncbi:MAG: tetratricopeptide repeat protein [Acidobacteriota bacterium]|nr:tetratricopeptide repeat protein [Acidobacteriota bacterium]
MNKTQWRELDELANKALDLNRKERKKMLEDLARENEQLALKLQDMLEDIDKANNFMESPACKGFADSLKTMSDQELPKYIGPYRILNKLGEGGMGIVYLAKQERPVRRRVALKVLKAGMSSNEALARFSSELQALAYMNHPFIDTIFDSGITGQGFPYFTTSYLNGLPITDYCREYCLSLEERLALFEKVCEGVQHAHRRGIIHRDLKPSNILVIRQGDELIPKIIDFGICKPMSGESLTDLTVYTRKGMFVGTPAYMSPEQIDGDVADLDTRVDCYSLGVVLYELLCGVLPHDPDELEVSFPRLLRIITRDDAPLPSARVLALAAKDLQPAANGFDLSANALSKKLRHDLDHVLLKALAKDRTQRYDSPAEIAADLKRHRNHMPVTASRPSMAYRTAKFFRRNRFAVISAAVAVFFVIAGITMLFLGYVEAIEAREEERQTRMELQYKVKQLENFDHLFFSFLEAPAPYLNRKDIKVVDLLNHVSANLEQRVKEPLALAHYRLVIGEAYCRLRVLDKAQPSLKFALDTKVQHLGIDHQETLEALFEMGKYWQVSGNRLEALHAFETIDEKAPKVLGPGDLFWFNVKHHLGSCLRDMGQNQQAINLFNHLLHTLDEKPSSEPTLRARIQESLAIAHKNLGNNELAKCLFYEAIGDLAHQEKPRHSIIARVEKNLCDLFITEGRYDKVEPLLSAAFLVHERELGKDHPTTLRSRQAWARLLDWRGQKEKAIEIYREIAERRARQFGEDHLETMAVQEALAISLKDTGALDEAKPILRSILEKRLRIQGRDELDTLRTRNNLGDCLRQNNQLEEAIELMEINIPILIRLGEWDGEVGLLTRCTLGETYMARGSFDEAERILGQLVSVYESKGDAGTGLGPHFKWYYGRALIAVKKYPKAKKQLLEAREAMEQSGSGELKDIEQDLKRLDDLWKPSLNQDKVPIIPIRFPHWMSTIKYL